MEKHDYTFRLTPGTKINVAILTRDVILVPKYTLSDSAKQ
jgi:hypothetical protein